MDEDQKLVALKMAYADIILNTAKEAASRIVTSEHKAIRYQDELFASKEEALHILLRLKQMMDSKINEAETISVRKQKRIEQLEAQLNEAEDIVRELRAELTEKQHILEKGTNNQLQQLTGTHINKSREGYRENESCVENCHEMYRNGCTHRIRAFERRLLEGKLSLPGKLDNLVNNTGIREDEEKSEGICKTPPMKCNTGKFNELDNDGIMSVSRKRKRVVRYKKHKTSTFSANNDMQSGKNYLTIAKDEDQKDQVALRSNTVELCIQTNCDEVNETHAKFLEACSDKSTVDKDNATSEVPTCEIDADMVNLQSNSKTSDSANGLPTRSGSDMFLKYTFRRKKKKEISGAQDNSSLEEKSWVEKSGEKQNGSLKPQNSSLITGTSRDSRRMAVVARQLISLSEKKWWQ